MHSRFFKTKRSDQKPFFNPDQQGSTDDALAGGKERGGFRPFETHPYDYRRMRFLPPKKSLDEQLKKLMESAKKCDGIARAHYLEQMIQFLIANPKMVNRVPPKFDSNPLELVLSLGDIGMAKKLLQLHANVRPQNRQLLLKVAHLLQLNYSQELTPAKVVPFRYCRK